MSRLNTRLVRQLEDWSYRYQLRGQLRRERDQDRDSLSLEFRDGYRLFREHGHVAKPDVLHWGRENE